jgi:hypothetical protein
MQEKTHTPGPWYVREQDDIDAEGNGYVWAVKGESHGSYIQNPGHANSEANARLMAAAPEMLKALEELLDLTALMPNSDDAVNDPELEPALERARAAIAKAQGEPT